MKMTVRVSELKYGDVIRTKSGLHTVQFVREDLNGWVDVYFDGNKQGHWHKDLELICDRRDLGDETYLNEFVEIERGV